MDLFSPHRQRTRVIEVCTDLLNVTPPVTELGLRRGRTIPCSLSTHHFTHCIFFTHSWVFHHHASTYKRKASLLFRSILGWKLWCTLLIPGFGSHRQVDIWVWDQFGHSVISRRVGATKRNPVSEKKNWTYKQKLNICSLKSWSYFQMTVHDILPKS